MNRSDELVEEFMDMDMSGHVHFSWAKEKPLFFFCVARPTSSLFFFKEGFKLCL